VTEGVFEQDAQYPWKPIQRLARKGGQIRYLTGLVIDDHLTAKRPK
jgi:hypothetical protein